MEKGGQGASKRVGGVERRRGAEGWGCCRRGGGREDDDDMLYPLCPQVPIHISNIKSCSTSEERDSLALRIDFFTPGQPMSAAHFVLSPPGGGGRGGWLPRRARA